MRQQPRRQQTISGHLRQDADDDEEAELQNVEASKQRIKTLFKQYDSDGNGVLSRAELQRLMTVVGGSITDDELDKVFVEIDGDQNGALDIDEFVEWMMSPASTVLVHASGEVTEFDLEVALRPLFEAYDRDNTGTIGFEEFKELHSILQGAIQVHADEEPDALFSSEVGGFQDVERVFRNIDTANDGVICLDEFVEWQRDAVENAEISKTRFVELVGKLAALLQSMDVVERAGHGREDSDLTDPLQDQIAEIARQLYVGDEDDKRPPANNVWEAPKPEGMRRATLLRTHMSAVPVPTCNVDKVDFNIFPCVPAAKVTNEDIDIWHSQQAEGSVVQRWFAKIVRKTAYKPKDQCIEAPRSKRAAKSKAKAKAKARADAASEPAPANGEAAHVITSEHYYCYKKDYSDGGKFQWISVKGEEYEQSLNALSPELQILAAVLTEADFADKLQWTCLQDALYKGAAIGIVDALQIVDFSNSMQSFAKQAVAKSYKEIDRLSMEMQQKLLDNFLARTFMMTPLEAMNILEDANLVAANVLWRDHENKLWQECKPASYCDQEEKVERKARQTRASIGEVEARIGA